MESALIQLSLRESLSGSNPVARLYEQLQNLVTELRKQDLPPDLVKQINQELEVVNTQSDASGTLKAVIRKRQIRILRMVEKKTKIVPRNHYRNLWMLLGMTTFGIPFGVLFGLLVKNMALLSIGLPIGMGVGSIVGRAMDKKAAKEGRQLAIEIKP